MADYTTAGVTGVTADNLIAVNARVDGAARDSADSLPKIQVLATEGIALDKIADYAEDNANPLPTVADYTTAGATLVTADNLIVVNARVDTAARSDADSLPKIQGLVAESIALARIVAYINDNTNPLPTVADYTTAGVTRVTTDNLNAVNFRVDNAPAQGDKDDEGEDVDATDSVAEIQILADDGIVLMAI